MSDFTPLKTKPQSSSMNILGPIVILIPVLIALYFCEWQVVAAFVVTILVVPLAIFFFTHLFEIFFQHKPMDFKEMFEMWGMFAVAGIPIYFILILPLYYILKSSGGIPMLYGFPAGVTIIMLLLFVLLATRSWGYKEVLVVIGCSALHSLFVIWLISKLKAISF